jgi:hypothetical protein
VHCFRKHCPFKIVSDRPALHSRWLLLLKIEISSIVHCCFIINLNQLKFLLQLHGNESDTILKGTHPRTIPAKFGLIWFRGFRGEDLNVKVYNVRQTPSELKKMAKRNKLEQGNQTFTIFQ